MPSPRSRFVVAPALPGGSKLANRGRARMNSPSLGEIACWSSSSCLARLCGIEDSRCPTMCLTYAFLRSSPTTRTPAHRYQLTQTTPLSVAHLDLLRRLALTGRQHSHRRLALTARQHSQVRGLAERSSTGRAAVGKRRRSVRAVLARREGGGEGSSGGGLPRIAQIGEEPFVPICNNSETEDEAQERNQEGPSQSWRQRATRRRSTAPPEPTGSTTPLRAVVEACVEAGKRRQLGSLVQELLQNQGTTKVLRGGTPMFKVAFCKKALAATTKSQMRFHFSS